MAVPPRRLAPGQHVNRRTGVANGRSLLSPQGDPHSWWARRFAEILALRLDDLGGADLLSESQISLSKRATSIEVNLEEMDAKLSVGAEVDLDLYGRLTGTLARVLEKLGLKQVARQVGPRNMAEYAAQKRGGTP